MALLINKQYLHHFPYFFLKRSLTKSLRALIRACWGAAFTYDKCKPAANNEPPTRKKATVAANFFGVDGKHDTIGWLVLLNILNRSNFIESNWYHLERSRFRRNSQSHSQIRSEPFCPKTHCCQIFLASNFQNTGIRSFKSHRHSSTKYRTWNV